MARKISSKVKRSSRFISQKLGISPVVQKATDNSTDNESTTPDKGTVDGNTVTSISKSNKNGGEGVRANDFDSLFEPINQADASATIDKDSSDISELLPFESDVSAENEEIFDAEKPVSDSVKRVKLSGDNDEIFPQNATSGGNAELNNTSDNYEGTDIWGKEGKDNPEDLSGLFGGTIDKDEMSHRESLIFSLPDIDVEELLSDAEDIAEMIRQW